MVEQLQALDQVKASAIDLAMKFGPRLVVAILILLAGHMAGRWAVRVSRPMLARFELEPPVRQLLERVIRIFVLALFAILALQNLGVELLPLIAGLGVAGAGIALATQGVLSNVVAGLTIIFTHPFRVGDYISIVKEEGEVQDISLFNTTLGHPDRSKIVIPNRRIVGEILHNYGKVRQLAVVVCVSGDADVAVAQAAIQEVLEANARLLKEPAPVVLVSRLADARIEIRVGPWVNVPDYHLATSEVNQAILKAFRLRSIDTPAPQREVRMLAARA